MSNLTDFFPSGGGGLTPKFQEFNASGTFTPTQALIDAGGYIEIFLVAGGGRGPGGDGGGNGGEVQFKKMYLTSVSNCSVTIGSGGANDGNSGGNSVFSGASAGGIDVTSAGGSGGGQQSNKLGAGWSNYSNLLPAGSGVLGYGSGGSYYSYGGIASAKQNSGQGVAGGNGAGSGYCLIKWYE